MSQVRKFDTIVTVGEPVILDSPDAVLTTLRPDGKRRWLYPTLTRGRFFRSRAVVAWVLIGLYVALPLIPISGKPAILLDLMHREFALFGTTFYPTDTVLLMLLFIGTLVAVVLASALLGRAWCGWACPQTVYLEFVFRPIERWIEGPEHTRKRQDVESMSLHKAWRKAAKWSLYVGISLVLAHSFVAYFVGWQSLYYWMTQPPSEHWGYFMMMSITTGLVLFDFGVFREQMCTITCPYARFQSVLLDRDSLIVSYDSRRGEPRMKTRDHGADSGDCVDCFACVRTCPVGIDIRDGLQMECVACTQCIDACDKIMDRLKRPRGLIRYTSQNALEGVRSRIVRPRTWLYGILMLVLSSLFFGALAMRAEFDVWVVRPTGEPFMELPDGQVANRLRFQVQNQTNDVAEFRLDVAAPTGAVVQVVGVQPVTLPPRALVRVEGWVTVPRTAFDRGAVTGEFAIRFDNGHVHLAEFPLLGPGS